MKSLKVGELIEILKQHDPELPVVITHDGKDHQYSIKDKEIKIVNNAYFGNDNIADEQIGGRESYLNLGYY
jgi:hypothetical protein